PTSSMIFTTAMRILLVGPRWSPWRLRPPAGRRAARRAPAGARARVPRRTRPRTARSQRRQPRPRPLWRSSVPWTKPSSSAVQLGAAALEEGGEVAEDRVGVALEAGTGDADHLDAQQLQLLLAKVIPLEGG